MKTTKPENFKKWLDELRSGNRNQGEGALRTVHVNPHDGSALVSDCCLGVACDISGLGRWEKISDDMPKRVYVIEGWGDEGDILPEPVLEWLGIKPSDAHNHPLGEGRFNLNIPETEIPSLYESEDRSYVGSAAEANDAGLSFKTIADLLEREYL